MVRKYDLVVFDIYDITVSTNYTHVPSTVLASSSVNLITID